MLKKNAKKNPKYCSQSYEEYKRIETQIYELIGKTLNYFSYKI